MALGFAGGMALESLVTEAPDEIGLLIGCMIASFSVAGYAATREGILGVGLLGLAVSVAIGVDPASTSATSLPPGAFVRCRPRSDSARTSAGASLAAWRCELSPLNSGLRLRSRRSDGAWPASCMTSSHAVTVIAVQAAAGQATSASDPAASGRSLRAIAESSRDALDELHARLGLPGAGRHRAPRGLARSARWLRPFALQGSPSNSTTARTGAPDQGRRSRRLHVLQEGLTSALDMREVLTSSCGRRSG